jgi:hypothetical protein
VVPQEVPEDLGVSVQALVPLQARVRQSVETQEMAVPWHVLPEQTSVWVQRFPSSQDAEMRHCQLPPALVQR